MSKSFADELLSKAGKGDPATTVPSTTQPSTTVPATTEPATTVPTTAPATTVPTTEPATTIPGTTEPSTTVPAGTTEPGTTVIPPTTTPISDEALLKSLIEKGVLKEGQTLEDLKPKETPDDIAKKNKELADQAVKHFLSKGTLELDKYNEYISDKTRPQAELAFLDFKEKLLNDIKGTSEEGTYTEDDIAAMYAKRGYSDKEQQRMAENYIRTKYSGLTEAEIVESYKVEQEQIQLATSYKGTVDKALSLLPGQIMITVGDSQVPYTPTKEAVEAVKELYLNENSFKAFSQVDAQKLSEAMIVNIKQHNVDHIIKEVSEALAAKIVEEVRLGRRGLDGMGGGNDDHGGGVHGKGSKQASKGYADEILDRTKTNG